jgi:opacity protein-like surface antigen
MFEHARSYLIGLAMLSCAAGPALSADYIPPPPDLPPPPPVIEEIYFGGWYIRGDFDYHWSKLRGTEYITYGCCVPDPGTGEFDTTSLKAAWSIGGGVGYQITHYLRTDLTLDYWSKSKFTGTTSGVCNGVPCSSTDESGYKAWLLLANAYVDLGTYHGFTPYVGAGIGGAYLMWDDLLNTDGGTTVVHEGSKNWRFAWALMAGASYCLTDRLEVDAGYRYTRVAGGRMWEYGSGVGPGFDSGLNVHEGRAGLRWHLGKQASRCAPPVTVIDYQPPEPPVYK